MKIVKTFDKKNPKINTIITAMLLGENTYSFWQTIDETNKTLKMECKNLPQICFTKYISKWQLDQGQYGIKWKVLLQRFPSPGGDWQWKFCWMYLFIFKTGFYRITAITIIMVIIFMSIYTIIFIIITFITIPTIIINIKSTIIIRTTIRINISIITSSILAISFALAIIAISICTNIRVSTNIIISITIIIIIITTAI